MAYAPTITDTPAGLAARVFHVLAYLADRRRKHALYHDTLSELSAMSDRDLADIGLRRGMIEDIARQAAYGA